MKEEKEEGNAIPMGGVSIEDAEAPEPEVEISQLSDVELVLTHMKKINTPQEQIQILGPLLDMILGGGSTDDQLSREQRIQAIRKTLEDKYGNDAGPLLSAFRNLIIKIK